MALSFRGCVVLTWAWRWALLGFTPEHESFWASLTPVRSHRPTTASLWIKRITFNCGKAAGKIVMEDSIFSKVHSNMHLKARLCCRSRRPNENGSGLSPHSWWIVLDGRTGLVVVFEKCLLNLMSFSKELIVLSYICLLSGLGQRCCDVCVWRPEEKFRELVLFQHARSWDWTQVPPRLV